MIRKNLCSTVIMLSVVMLFPILAREARGQDLSKKDRRLTVAVLGFEFNEAAAKDALADGANINAKNGALGGETVLITAIKGFKDPQVVRFLLDNGADANLKDDSGQTALSLARKYNIGRKQNGRDILKMLEDATGQAATNTDKPAENTTSLKTTTVKTTTTDSKPARRVGGAPTAEEIKETLEKSFTKDYQNHFFGVRNKVTFEWIGSITVGAPETRGRIPTRCYPAKLNVKVTAEDPRDGNRSSVTRGTEAMIGGYSKTEIFCFSRNGFGEWGYVTYEP